MDVNSIPKCHATIIARFDDALVVTSTLKTQISSLQISDASTQAYNAVNEAHNDMLQEKYLFIITTIPVVKKFTVSNSVEGRHNLTVEYSKCVSNILTRCCWFDIVLPDVKNEPNLEAPVLEDPESIQESLIGPLSGMPAPVSSKVQRDKRCKFPYNWISRFRDCIKKYQGKQTCRIPDKIYKDLDDKFNAYKLLIPNIEGFTKYSKVTKAHIALFLRELKCSKHYENLNLIYYTLTDKRDDISHLEHDLMIDFKQLLSIFEHTDIDRKDFMDVNYTMCQLLIKNGYTYDSSSFLFMKVGDRHRNYNKLCNILFDKLGWRFKDL